MSARDRSILTSIVTTAVVVTGGALAIGTTCLGLERWNIPSAAPPREPQPSPATITAAEVTSEPDAPEDHETPFRPAATPVPPEHAPLATATAPPAKPAPGNAQHVPTALVPRTPLVQPLDAADGGHVEPPPAATIGSVDAAPATATADAAAVAPLETPRRWMTEPPPWGASHMEPNPEAGAGRFTTEWSFPPEPVHDAGAR